MEHCAQVRAKFQTIVKTLNLIRFCFSKAKRKNHSISTFGYYIKVRVLKLSVQVKYKLTRTAYFHIRTPVSYTKYSHYINY